MSRCYVQFASCFQHSCVPHNASQKCTYSNYISCLYTIFYCERKRTASVASSLPVSQARTCVVETWPWIIADQLSPVCIGMFDWFTVTLTPGSNAIHGFTAVDFSAYQDQPDANTAVHPPDCYLVSHTLSWYLCVFLVRFLSVLIMSWCTSKINAIREEWDQNHNAEQSVSVDAG